VGPVGVVAVGPDEEGCVVVVDGVVQALSGTSRQVRIRIAITILIFIRQHSFGDAIWTAIRCMSF